MHIRTSEILAFDRGSVRTISMNGHMHVAETNISKAAINPYRGREIPNWEGLGLDPTKIYRLFRDPDELEKAAPTFNNLPLLSRHVPVSADNHPHELVVGSTGTGARFAAPFLRNGLVIWKKGAIDAVEDDTQKELSSSYRYRADMTPGHYEGQAYDGRMRDIVGNHVALVKVGRAGSDVVVGDSNEEIEAMSKKVLLSHAALMTLGVLHAGTAPLLAQDARLPDFIPIVAELTAENFKDKKADVITGYTAAMKDVKLAQDASIDPVIKLLDDIVTGKATDAEKTTTAFGIAADEFPPKKNDDDEDCSPEEKAKRKAAKEKMAKDTADTAKVAMDAAVSTAVAAAVKVATDAAIKTQRDIREAEKVVRPWVGELTVAFDTAEDVYKTALTGMGVKVDGVHPSAYRAILEVQPKPGAKQPPKLAQDAAGTAAFEKRFPHTQNIQVA